MNAGRPKSSSRTMIEEAAAELFLEQSYAGTSVEEITSRAGVSRASFFNYFSAKSDLLWIDVDTAIDQFEALLISGVQIREAAVQVSSEIGSSKVPLSVTESDVMGTAEELTASGLARVARLARALGKAEWPQSHGISTLLERRVEINAICGALAAAWMQWALAGTNREELVQYVSDALALVGLE
ncbi:MAG: TetR family transcriptional regulator [Cryobacterium sp.]|nr:TetR family transcriptional regulator [Cryobacterium sp.]